VDAALGYPVLVGLIGVALLFDFLNGLHDAANSIATIVSTRVLRPQFAVLWAAFFNFVAFTVFGLHVAQTIGTGIIDPAVVDARVIFAALVGAIVWNLVTWALGIPSSSSHALIGGLVGGGMANHFVRAIGLPVGRSLLEEDKVPLAREILDYCKESGKTIALPSDFVVAKSPEDGASAKTVGIQKIPDDLMALDVGPKTLEQFARLLAPAKTIFWNGPMGVFEKEPFDAGTMGVARIVAASPAVTVVGGGESVQAAHAAGVAEKFTHVSTGGGASLEFLAEWKLPGIEALD